MALNVKQTIETLIHFPIEEAILIKGDHGIGKSKIVQKAAEMLGVPCVDFRLSQNDVGDLKGMPFHVRGRTVFAPPEFMPLSEQDSLDLKELIGLTEDIGAGRFGDKGILFLDEINRANREVQQAAFELVLDRRLNLRSLPSGWRVVAAINDDEDIYTVGQMEPAFLSRFYVIDFKPTQQEWFAWAEEVGIHDAILSFLKKFPELLDPTKELLKESVTRGVVKVHDRRAWEKFSRTLLKLQADHEDGKFGLDPLNKARESLDYLATFGTGFVGHLAAVKFKNYVETDYQSLDANVILNKWDKDVEKRLQDVIDKGRIPELASYNEMVIEYIQKKNIKALKPKQKQNLISYVGMLPNEVIGDFWVKFIDDAKSAAEDWYQSDKVVSEIILKALVNPENKKKIKSDSK